MWSKHWDSRDRISLGFYSPRPDFYRPVMSCWKAALHPPWAITVITYTQPAVGYSYFENIACKTLTQANEMFHQSSSFQIIDELLRAFFVRSTSQISVLVMKILYLLLWSQPSDVTVCCKLRRFHGRISWTGHPQWTRCSCQSHTYINTLPFIHDDRLPPQNQTRSHSTNRALQNENKDKLQECTAYSQISLTVCLFWPV